MAHTNKLQVKVYPKEGDPGDPLVFDVNFLSFVSFETYGVPAVIADEKTERKGFPVRVLYVNPANVEAVEAIRTA